jgi:hypothetical protein
MEYFPDATSPNSMRCSEVLDSTECCIVHLSWRVKSACLIAFRRSVASTDTTPRRAAPSWQGVADEQRLVQQVLAVLRVRWPVGGARERIEVARLGPLKATDVERVGARKGLVDVGLQAAPGAKDDAASGGERHFGTPAAHGPGHPVDRGAPRGHEGRSLGMRGPFGSRTAWCAGCSGAGGVELGRRLEPTRLASRRQGIIAHKPAIPLDVDRRQVGPVGLLSEDY